MSRMILKIHFVESQYPRKIGPKRTCFLKEILGPIKLSTNWNNLFDECYSKIKSIGKTKKKFTFFNPTRIGFEKGTEIV